MSDQERVIWVVEDDPNIQRLLSFRLKKHGMDPVVFESAEKAYAALRFSPLPSLILLDILLPGMSGVDLVRLLKMNAEWEKIPVVVVSVLRRSDLAEVPDESGTPAFWINKPFDADKLMGTIENILSSVR